MVVESFEKLVSRLSLDEFYAADIGPDNSFIQVVDEIIRLYPNKCKDLLDRYRDFGYPDENDHGSAFLEIVAELVEKRKNPDDLPLILSYFDDSIEATDIFDCLVVQIEKYYLAGLPYIETLLRNLGGLNRKAIAWAGRLVARILSSPDAYAIFKQNVSQANPDDLVCLLQYMRCHEDDFDYVEAQVEELLNMQPVSAS